MEGDRLVSDVVHGRGEGTREMRAVGRAKGEGGLEGYITRGETHGPRPAKGKYLNKFNFLLF